MAQKTYKYSDVSLYADQTQKALVFDEQSVNQNILMILTTPIRSAWFNPSIGCLITEYLFDPVDDFTADKIKDEIISVLPRNLETRVVIKGVLVQPMPDDNMFYVTLEYDAPDLNKKDIVFNFNLGMSL
jgi:phage baseplate assembly protein W|uniref:Baseplate wedge protein n=1 Tax=Myoviridae sp. ctshb19 TaxID=2825194 RepID=A0A8S5UG22_9CAUD|nr:MAG TPA: Baseplate wedge protein [Myoviridae sp. ctshb19]